MATFDDFEFVEIKRMLDEVSPDELPGCPKPLVLKHVRRAAIDFCKHTQWFRATLDPITVVRGVGEVPLDSLSDDVDAGSIFWAKLNGRGLKPGEFELMDSGKGLVLTPPPGATLRNGLLVRAVLQPSADFQTLEKHLFESWREAIGAGALHTLKMIPNKAWTDREAAGYYALEFRRMKLDALNDALRGRHNGNLETKYRRHSV